MYNLLYVLFNSSIVFNTQPQAVKSMLVHVYVSACICIVYNTQSIGSVSYVHPPVLDTTA